MSNSHDGLSEHEMMAKLLEEKKALLSDSKKKYSELTTIQFSTNQEYSRMQKALKNQMAAINRSTKKYVDISTNIALAEAEGDYFKATLSLQSAGFDQEQELKLIGKSRDRLKDKLAQYRAMKIAINEHRNKLLTQNQSLRQECLNVGFYCKDIRAKMDSDIKKQIDRQHLDSNNSCKKHLKDTNKSAMTVANRVLDCREEVLGFFKQQVRKVKRDERLAQEERDLSIEKNMQLENSEAITENVVDSFVKNQKIFPASDENTDENTEGDEPTTPPSTLNPRPPSQEPPSASTSALRSLVASNLKGGRGNMVGSTARQRRKERNSAFSTMNIDRIGDDLIRGCETEGNTSKLRALKQAMQNHVLYQVSFILMLENELKSEHLLDEFIRKGSVEDLSVIHSLQSVKGSVTTDTAKEGKKNAGHFGQSLGKLCAISSGSIANDEGYMVNSSRYLEMLHTDMQKTEESLLSASTLSEETLYKTCVDGIKDPWDPSVLKSRESEHPKLLATTDGHGTSTLEESIDASSANVNTDTCFGSCTPAQDNSAIQTADGSACAPSIRSRPSYFRAHTMSTLVTKATSLSHDKDDQKNDKNFGLLKWLSFGNFEGKLAQILSAEVKTMNDIPIELGLAKLTSMSHIIKNSTAPKAQKQQFGQRSTMVMAPSSAIGAAGAIPGTEKKVYITGLEKL